MSAPKFCACAVVLCLVLGGTNFAWAQSAPLAPETETATAVPRLIRFSGTVKDGDGNPRTEVTAITFALYKEQEGGAALWLETQNVSPNAQGHYEILLGSTTAAGIPTEAFSANEARYLGVQPEGQPEQRILLVSVPYALKAADAETLGGMPASSFVLAAASAATTTSSAAQTGTNASPSTAPSPTISGSGTQNSLAKFDSSGTNLVSSSISDTGTAVSTTEPVGLGTTIPNAQLDVEFTTATPINALLSNITYNNSAPVNNAVVSALDVNFMDGSVAANLSKQAARIAYIRQAGATGGVTAFDTALTATEVLHANSPFPVRGINIEGPTMDTGTTLLNFTGLYIGSPSGAGTVTSRSALLTEPGAGNVGIGTLTPGSLLEVAGNVAATGGGVFSGDGSGLVNLNAANLAGTLPSSTLFEVNGSGLTNVNASLLQGIPANDFATNGSNTFLGNQSVHGILSVTGNIVGAQASVGLVDLPNTETGGPAPGLIGAIILGGTVFLHNYGNSNTFVGPSAGNMTMTGSGNTAVGFSALTANTTGGTDSAFGYGALAANTTGSANSAFGYSALAANTTGQSNSALGYNALSTLQSGSDNIAIGQGAGSQLNGAESNNIYIGNNGVAGESGVIRIGLAGTQTATFIAGISGATSGSGTAVFVNSAGQFGTLTSSRRFKHEIADIGTESDLLMKLRPVAFYYRPELDDTQTRQYGLVAEEVAKIAPQLVVYDKDGAPQTVRYHFVNALLLDVVQKQQRTIARQQAEIEDLAERLAELEAIVNRKP